MVEINGIKYLLLTEVSERLKVSRQTLWRWRQQAKIPGGHKYRDRKVVFSPDEVEAIREFADRIEPIGTSDSSQLRLFNGLGSKS